MVNISITSADAIMILGILNDAICNDPLEYDVYERECALRVYYNITKALNEDSEVDC